MALLDLLTRPPRLPRALERPRLRDLLLGGIEPGRLVVAPPGSGKTVAAAQLLDAGDGPTAWCRLAPGASGGDDLVRLVAAALGTSVDDPGTGPLERAATLLDVLGDRPVVLVVDDYDLARPEECDAVLAEVLGLISPDCRLVVCSALRPGPCQARGRRQYCHLCGEPVPVPPHGVEDGPWRPSIAHGLPDLRQTIAQRVFLVALLCGPGPELLEQIALSHGQARMLHEIRQHPQGQGLQCHHLAPPAQLVALGIQLTLAKDIAHIAYSFGHSPAAWVTQPARLCTAATRSLLGRATGHWDCMPSRAL